MWKRSGVGGWVVGVGVAARRGAAVVVVAAIACGGGCSGDDGTGAATDGTATATATTGTSASSATAGTSATSTEGTSATDSTAGTSTGTSGPTTTATGGETTGEETTGGETTGGPVDPPPTVCEALALVDTGGATVVGDGTPGSCTEAALASAVAGGGAVVFDCGDDPHTITLSVAIPVTADVVIDGDDRITLAGAGADRLLAIETGNFEALTPHLTVQRLHFTGGRASGTAIPLGTDVDGGGGAIYLHGGSLTVLDSSFTGNACALEGPDVGGGAIYGVGAGSITVSGSSFNANQGANGGAIGALGMDLTVINSTLVANEATGFGANYVENNEQMGRGGNGGAIVMDGKGKTLELCGVEITDNISGAFGGAVFRTSYESEPTTIDRSLFADNQARDREDDLPSGAGALYLQGSTVTMTASTVAGNQARSSAGVWILGHGPAPAVADLTNVTLSGNATWPREPFTDRGLSGGLTIGDNTTGTLQNCTIYGNAAQFASGIARASTLTIRNTIIANLADNEYTPLNCTGTSYATPPAAGDGNIQWPNGLKDDMDCTPGILRADPLMGELADNGGPTPTIMPSDGSPALAAGSGCPAYDQRGEPRSEPCTLGAVEVL